MVLLTSLLYLAAAFSSVLSSPGLSRPRHVLHERRDTIPSGWSLRRRADPDSLLLLRFALVQSNLHNLERYLLDISDPESSNYGKHWTHAKVEETFRPLQESVDSVRSWLSTGVHPERIQLSRNGAYLHVNVSVSDAENLLATKYYVYEHDETGLEHIACENGYHLPENVARHVDLVAPTVHFDTADARAMALSRRLDKSLRPTTGPQRPGRHSLRPFSASKVAVTDSNASSVASTSGAGDCSHGTTLSCIHALYDFNYDLVASERNTIAVAESGQESYNSGDLDTFFKKYSPELAGARPKLISLNGGVENPESSQHTVESNMDFMLVMGLLGKKQSVLQYQVGQDSDFYDGIFSAFDGSYCKDGSSCQQAKANVVSVSYVSPETSTNTYLQRQCNEFGKLSLTGTTFVFASGDYGVAFPGDLCLADDHATSVQGKGNFFPAFPATCQYVTSVGATHVPYGKSAADVEVAVDSFGSGGGFSNLFPRPSYQDRLVGAYLGKYAPDYGPGVYNTSGRGIPDVSANGDGTMIIENGGLLSSGGTSASAPIFASMLAAVNDARIAAGKSTVGWINPALYSSTFANVFNDVTAGSNPGCGTRGFQAVPGWDPVTGLGTVNFPRLLSRFMALP
ncbi:subtilisin-like protein [Trametes polyzona]|nr:subtilisin-like protein [Trametes polyzona]